MNNYRELYQLVIDGFIKNGFEICLQNSFITTMRRWKVVHKTEDLKVIETVVNIILNDDDNPSQVLVRYAYYEK